jgi:hypothetical protein
MKVYLKYTFVFDTDCAWQRKDDFENDLFSYFLGNGLEAHVATGPIEDMDEKLIVLEKYAHDEVPAEPQVTPKNPVFTKAVNSLTKQSGGPKQQTGPK